MKIESNTDANIVSYQVSCTLTEVRTVIKGTNPFKIQGFQARPMTPSCQQGVKDLKKILLQVIDIPIRDMAHHSY